MRLAAWLVLVAAGGGPTPAAPMTVVISTARGETRLPVRVEPEIGPMVAAPTLIGALKGSERVDGAWAEIEIASQSFRFLLGAPIYRVGQETRPLVGAARLKRDTLFLPIQFVTQVLPGELSERFSYDRAAGRLVELTGRAVAAASPPPAAGAAGPAATASATAVKKVESDRLPNGLRKGHVVAIDPGHGGTDPGNPGIHFPRGVREKDVTLKVGLLLKDELLSRGVSVIMTRKTDTLINLMHRGAYCQDRCDLFMSLHVNSLPRRAGYTKARGYETYYLDAARTEDAARVARMENEAVRFEEPGSQQPGGLDFILKDLQLNEHLREAVRLAELTQSHLGEVHTGPDRGVKPARLAVLTTARRPAVLVELGFSTNPEDARLMTTTRSQRHLASSLADAVVTYLLEYEQRVGDGTATASRGSGRE
ncbi:MAG: N-acetylmuramoyl-L-alanine amidase [Gemmatimonadales bacterium]